MKNAGSSQNEQYPAVNIELLGKPIHIIREQLEQLFNQAQAGLVLQLSKWTKSADIKLTLQQVSFNHQASDNHSFFESILQYQQHGLLQLQISQTALLYISDCFYDELNSQQQRAITSSDFRLLQRISALFASVLAPSEMWQETEQKLDYQQGLTASFKLTINHSHEIINVNINDELIQVLIQQLNLQASPLNPADLEQVLVDTPLILQATLLRKKMSLQQVCQLQADDILPIELMTQVPISIGGIPLFSGRVTEQNGQLAVLIKNTKEIA